MASLIHLPPLPTAIGTRTPAAAAAATSKRPPSPVACCSSSSSRIITTSFLPSVSSLRLLQQRQSSSKAAYLRPKKNRSQAEGGEGGGAEAAAAAAAAPAAAPPAADGGVKKHAFIHDFCFGITYGILTVISGVAWYLVTRRLDGLRVAALFGATILMGGVGSLRAWKQRQSSTPYILGQAVLTAVLAYQALLRYQRTGSILMALSLLVSASMVVFYIYVIMAGGNPPPSKKFKVKQAQAS